MGPRRRDREGRADVARSGQVGTRPALRDADADPSLLAAGPIGVVGYGNQGAAQALCLRDAGRQVRVFTRPGGASEARARADGFAATSPADLTACGVIAVLVADEAQAETLHSLVNPKAPAGAVLVFAHGFALDRGGIDRIRPDLDVALVGPLGPGALLRRRWLDGNGLAGVLAVARDATGTARARALAYAALLRMTRAGVLPTTVEEEVVSDLFAEQVVLVGGVVELMRAAWETLVAGGVSEEIAYYSCVQELKQMLDVVHAEGIAGMRGRISGTAAYGGLTRGPRAAGGPAAREEMRRILDEIRSGAFAQEWGDERARGSPRLGDLLRREAAHPMEDAGRRVRAWGEVDTPEGRT